MLWANSTPLLWCSRFKKHCLTVLNYFHTQTVPSNTLGTLLCFLKMYKLYNFMYLRSALSMEKPTPFVRREVLNENTFTSDTQKTFPLFCSIFQKLLLIQLIQLDWSCASFNILCTLLFFTSEKGNNQQMSTALAQAPAEWWESVVISAKETQPWENMCRFSAADTLALLLNKVNASSTSVYEVLSIKSGLCQYNPEADIAE